MLVVRIVRDAIDVAALATATAPVVVVIIPPTHTIITIPIHRCSTAHKTISIFCTFNETPELPLLLYLTHYSAPFLCTSLFYLGMRVLHPIKDPNHCGWREAFMSPGKNNHDTSFTYILNPTTHSHCIKRKSHPPVPICYTISLPVGRSPLSLKLLFFNPRRHPRAALLFKRRASRPSQCIRTEHHLFPFCGESHSSQ